MRHEHWLPPARPSLWPGAVLCLSCDVAWAKADPTSVREYARLAGWYTILCVRQGDGYAVARHACGSTAESWWDTLRTASLRGRNVWVIGSCFRAEAAVLGLWERMESGHVEIAGSDPRRQVPARQVRSVRTDYAGVHLSGEPQVDAHTPTPRLSRPPAKDPRSGHSRRKRERSATSGIFVVEDPPIILHLKIDGGGGKVVWVDAANYGLDSAAMGYGAAEIASSLATWLGRAASALCSLGPCGWQATAASQSTHLFRAVYHETPILCHTNPLATALERDGLFGGRCEPFALGRIGYNVHMLDFRSLYPYLYSTERVPIRLLSVVESPPVESILESDPQQWYIARVDIETDEPEYPYHAGDAAIYPTGRFTSCLCGAELARAARQGHIRRIRRMATYKAECVLKRYAEELYRLRRQADERADRHAGEYVKRLMNCLHGKFAQVERRWVDVPGADAPWEWGECWQHTDKGEWYRVRSIAGRVQREERGGFAHGSCPAIAAAISSAGRARLAAAIQAAGSERVLYCDTDAIITDDYGLESLTLAGWVRPGEWGYLQHVISGSECDIFGVKHYRIGERTRESGRRKTAEGGCGESASVVRMPGTRERLRVQLPPADWREQRPYHRGPGRYDQQREPGGRVRPVEVDEWEYG